MKKKLYAKKILSVFLAVLMLMTSWVFVAPELADAAGSDSKYPRSADKYGTPYWTANDNNTRWMLWGSNTNSGTDHIYIKVPKTIYLDVSETLQSAGYRISLNWYFGDSTDYRMVIGPATYGNGNGISGQSGPEQFTMNNMFSGYTVDSSNHGSSEGTASDSDLIQNDNYDGNTGVIVYKNTGSGKNWDNTLYMVGTPNGAGSGRYSTTEINPSPFNSSMKWKYVFPSNKWAKHNDSTFSGKPASVSEQLYGYNEVWWDIEVYDKAPLKTAADNADTVYTNNYSLYNTYVLNDGLTALKNLADEGRNMLTVREQTKATVEAKTNAINTAANGLEFQAKNAELKTKVAEAQVYLDRIKLYTDASTSALQDAINAAKNSTLYSNPPKYIISQYSDAGSRAAADQASIATLIKNINDAKNALVRKYDVGYDNLFSLTDWALNPVKNGKLGSNGTIEIDADNGTIKITHDGSNAGTDNNTSQQPTYYRSQVKGNTEYVLTWDTEGAGRAQIHAFYTTGDQYTYNVNSNYNSGSHWFVSNGDLPYSSDMGHHEVAFTTLPETDGLVFRFGTCNAGDSVTFSNIRLVEKSVYDAYAKNYNTVREAFAVGDTKNLSLTPAREGYVFDGWFTANGTKVTSVSGLGASEIVYARWSQNFTVTFKNEDGSVLKTQKVAPGAAATAPSNPTKAATKETEYAFNGWDKDFSNVQSDLVVTATYKNKAHTFVKSYLTGSTCTAAATYTQYCGNNCGASWGDEVFTDASMPALGHTYDRANPTSTVQTGTSTGKTDDDLHTIKCNECDATKTVKHNFQEDKSNPAVTATCTVKGETYYKCACLETKTVTGTTNPDNHVNTKLINVKAAACEVKGYTGDTYCNDCKKTVATGTATDALEHVFTVYVDQNDATCDTEGTKVATCDREGCNGTDTQYTGKKREHSFTNYVDQNDATCDTEGTEIATCDYDDCKATDSRSTGKKREHNFETTPTVKNNENGTHTYTYECAYDDCNATTTKNVNCGYGAWTTDNAATHSHTCTACGYTPDAEGHDWSAWTHTNGTGTTASTTQTRSCKVCGRVETTDCNYKVTKSIPATCEAAEILTYQCTICGHGYTTSGEGAKGHNFTAKAGVKNYDNGQHAFACSNECGEYGIGTTKGSRVPCSDWTYANTEAGKHTATCNVCSYEKTDNCSGGTPTCTAQAICDYCGKAYGDKAAHVITGTEKYLKKATDATCIANETYYKYCINCENEFSTETYEKPETMAAHDYTCTDEYLYIATQAKCGANETYYAYCSNADCKKSSEDANNTYEKADTELEHKFDGTVVGNENGTHTITCSQTNTDSWACDKTADYNCADTEALVGVVNAECLTAGYNMYKCRLCDYEWTVETEAALGHEYTEVNYNNSDYVKEAANCYHGTIYWYGCKWCDANGKNETDTEKYPVLFIENQVDKRKHNFGKIVDEDYLASAATCLAAAKYYYSCTHEDCGAKDETQIFSDFVTGKALGHDWIKPAEDVRAQYQATPADCVNDATYYYVCSRADECKVKSSQDVKKDGETWTDEGSKSGHDLAHTAAKEATCTENGNYEYWYCSTCKIYFKNADATVAFSDKDAAIIRSPGHNYVEYAYKAATCEKDGHNKHRICSVCEAEDPNYKKVEYSATGHNFDGAYYYDAVYGYHAKYCSNDNCDKVTLTDSEGKTYEVNSFGIVVKGEQIKYAVSYEDDVAVVTGGEKCVFTYKADTDKNGVHTHSNSCVCGNNSTKTYSDEETFVKTVLPTCTAGGYDAYACPDESCGATWTKNETPKNGHTPAAAPVSNGDGTHSVYCTVVGCGAKLSTAKCYGGTATCKDQAVCGGCNTAYGSTADHSFTGEWKYLEDAKCGVNGNEENTCTVCETKVIREKAGTALTHKMSTPGYEVPSKLNGKLKDYEIIVAPNCKNEGMSISYCTNSDDCFYYVTTNVGASGEHVYGDWSYVSGDCGTGATYRCVCEVCGDVKTDVRDADHTWKLNTDVAPTCDKVGYKRYVCVNCKFTKEENYNPVTGEHPELAPTGHTVTEWTEGTANCQETAYKTGKCTVCDEYDIVELEGFGAHNMKAVSAQEATCEAEGYNDHMKCTVCGLTEGKETTSALGHADTDGDGKCEECNRVIYGDGTKSCGCICHKENFLMKFLYKILNFFWKLFKISQTCDCGTVHW